ncbi:MAG: 3-hydroxyacyl-ACP dehydratase FabZ family protein [Planctomycetota bacterium]
MPPQAILDPATLDFSKLVAGHEQILRVNPQRHEFALLDAIVLIDHERQIYAGYHDIRPNEWWTRGHIPGRPLFPGVLMIETAAQLASYLTHDLLETDSFVGLAGIDEVKYRGTVEPPCRFVVVGKPLRMRTKRTECATQGFVNGKMVFEARISGMLIE